MSATVEPHPSDQIESALRDLAADAPGFTSDSRQCVAGEIFVALRGEHIDGHDFVPALVAKGARAVVTRGTVSRLGLYDAAARGKLVEVDDPHRAHRALAGLFRRRFTGRVVAVGGSSGKTTAKEFLAAILTARFKIAKTDRSQNGELGVPKTLEKLHAGIEVAVVEIGIDALGDMGRHAPLVAPDLAMLTSIGEEHLNLLGSVENVFREEAILFDTTRANGGACFAPEDDPWLARLNGTPGVRLVGSDPAALDRRLITPLRSIYARRNAALACAVALELGMTAEKIAPVLWTLEPPEGRGTEKRLPGGAILLADHYNANPSSMRAGLAAARARATEDAAPLRLILGDMLDLGDRARDAHQALVDELRAAQAETIWLIGPEMSRLAPLLSSTVARVRCWPDSTTAAAEASELATGTAVILLKGSRGMALERVLDVLIR